jgi:G3E family GTPase
MLQRYGDRLERLIVETSGLADPAPVLQTFLADPDIRDRVELESVVAVVDACHAKAQLGDDIAREQIVFADRIIINKTDVASRTDVTSLVELICSLNPSASIDVSHQSAVDVDTLLGVRSFSLDNLLSVEPGLLTDGEHDHEHDNSIASCAFIIPGALDAGRFNRWINQLVQSQGQSLLRMKGVLNLNGEARRLHFHSVHMLLDSHFGKPWSGEARDSKFVVIGRNLDEVRLRDGLLSCTS